MNVDENELYEILEKNNLLDEYFEIEHDLKYKKIRHFLIDNGIQYFEEEFDYAKQNYYRED